MILQKRVYTLLIVVLACLQYNTLVAQLSNKDSLLYKTAIENTQQVYYKNIGDQATKYNGSQYQGYTVSFSDGQPYYKIDALRQGTILYNGVLFKDVQLLYDEIADCVILQDSAHRIKLVNEKLKSFSILEDRFERLEKDNDNNPIIGTGFYQVLTTGKAALYKKETKKMIDKFTNSTELSVLFEIHEYYYIKKSGRFFEIKNKKSLYSILGEKAKELMQYTKKEKLNYRKEKDLMLTSVVDYYNKLSQ